MSSRRRSRQLGLLARFEPVRGLDVADEARFAAVPGLALVELDPVDFTAPLPFDEVLFEPEGFVAVLFEADVFPVVVFVRDALDEVEPEAFAVVLFALDAFDELERFFFESVIGSASPTVLIALDATSPTAPTILPACLPTVFTTLPGSGIRLPPVLLSARCSTA